jgi:hypothetical protein
MLKNMASILSSIINIVEGTYVTFNEHYNLHFDAEEDFHIKLWILWGKWLRPRFGSANHLVLIECSICWGKWAKVGKKKVTPTDPYMYLTLYAEYRTHARSPTFFACGDLLPNHGAIINRTFHFFLHPFDRQKTTQKIIKKKTTGWDCQMLDAHAAAHFCMNICIIIIILLLLSSSTCGFMTSMVCQPVWLVSWEFGRRRRRKK